MANGETVYTIRFDAAHPIFAGHFPGHPIVPGACLVQIAQELTARATGRSGAFTQIRNLKFRQPVTPDQQLTVTIQEKASSSLNFQLSTLNSTCASFTATYMCPDTDVQ
ncbi:MAG: hypothetical protein II605_02900 [Paludibacteraceae bacterium]|nr:hypothetical protein [Paludibacteraceae bacterium]